MIPLLRCLLFIAATGAAGFLVGRVIPKSRLRYDTLPFRELPFENGGHFYRKIRIHRWQKRLPDMSRILPFAMPPKQVKSHVSAAQAEVMVQETCVAEVIHWLLSVTGLGLPLVWPGIGGWAVFAVYFLLGNLPFILIQRFNRPKLRMLLEKCRQAEARKAREQTEV